MTLYLDNASTTRIRPEVLEVMAPLWKGAYGNPSSMHSAGRHARRVIEDSRERIAAALNVSPLQIIFTSGATEANNLALFGSSPSRLVTTAVEHESVLHAARRLSGQGVDVDIVPADGSGRIRPPDVERALSRPTSLVSVMWVNNEVGSIQPVGDVAALARGAGALLHVDAVQGLGKLPWDVSADLASISSHKIHGPKGIGALIVRDPARLRPILLGGAQEFEKRAGTENVAAIAGFSLAVELAIRDLPTQASRVARLRDRLESGLVSKTPGAAVNAASSLRAPHVSSIRFEGIDAEALLMALDGRGVCASAGSACAALGTEPSHVLVAMGLDPRQVKGSMRFSLAHDTTEGEIDEAVSIVSEVVASLRKIK
jgi:cysteine desulfurase